MLLRDNVKGDNIGTKNQFIVKEGQFVISKIDARNGSFGIVGDELNNAVITADFLNFEINKNIVNDKFLIMALKTPYYIKILDSLSSGTTGRKRINEEKFLNINISLPPVKEQNNLMEKLTIISENIKTFLIELDLKKEEILKNL